MFYLSSPYGAEFQKGILLEQVLKVTTSAIEGNINMFSPVIYGSSFLTRGIDETHWKHFNNAMLRHSSRMVILELPGWDSCQGMSEDLDIARRCAIPVSRITEVDTDEAPEILALKIQQGFVNDFLDNIQH